MESIEITGGGPDNRGRMAPYHLSGIRGSVLGVVFYTCLHAQAPVTTPLWEQGMASWYGGGFQGQRAASGEIYDQQQLTAAHRTLPFGTKVRVRRLDSDESVVVRINDRGPYARSRIIDLSSAAARLLGMTSAGLIPVAIEVMENVPVSDSHAYFAVQAGTFREPDNARRTRALMEEKYGEAHIVAAHDYWCVVVGHSATQAGAQALATEVRKSDSAFQSAYVVRLDPATIGDSPYQQKQGLPILGPGENGN